jgi:hypothetical protein
VKGVEVVEAKRYKTLTEMTGHKQGYVVKDGYSIFCDWHLAPPGSLPVKVGRYAVFEKKLDQYEVVSCEEHKDIGKIIKKDLPEKQKGTVFFLQEGTMVIVTDFERGDGSERL